jgi:hypothetical protein
MAATVLNVELDTAELEQIVTEFTSRVDQAMESSGDFADYVSQLEIGDVGGAAPGLDPRMSGELVSEIEDFLREH